jgi:hypothetical protein
MADTLTRPEMEAIIGRGESVLHGGEVITNVAGLPSEAALAKGDPARENQAEKALKAQIAELEGQLSLLKSKPAESSAGLAAMILAGTVPEISERIGGLSDKATLEALHDAESRREPQARKGVTDAIEKRLGEIAEN